MGLHNRLPLVFKNFFTRIFQILYEIDSHHKTQDSLILKLSRNNYELLNEITIGVGHNLRKRNIELQDQNFSCTFCLEEEETDNNTPFVIFQILSFDVEKVLLLDWNSKSVAGGL